MRDDVHRDDLAPYLLGALAEPDAAALERHLEGCPRCRAALEELRPAVSALPEGVAQVEPPKRLKASLMAAVEAEPQAAAQPARTRVAPHTAGPLARGRLSRLWPRPAGRPRLAFAAALLVAVGIAVGYGLGTGGDDPRVVAGQVDRARIPSGTASLRVQDGVLRVRDFPAAGRGRAYQVWLRRNGRVSSQGVFVVNAGGRGAAALTQPLSNRDEVLVTREPAGGSSAPTEQPVLSIDV